jgi:hypothetical protein
MTHFSHVLKDRSSQIARDTILDLGLAAMCLIDEGRPLARFVKWSNEINGLKEVYGCCHRVTAFLRSVG